MSQERSKIIELAKKLKALCDRGDGGEKMNAEKMLNDLLEKHNLTIREIEGEEIKMHFFTVEDRHKELFIQIIKLANVDLKVYGKFPPEIIAEQRLSGNFSTECTNAEMVEIDAKMKFFSKHFDLEYDIFFGAYCRANDLLVTPKKEDRVFVDDLSEDQLEKRAREIEMSDKIKKGQFFTPISEKNQL